YPPRLPTLPTRRSPDLHPGRQAHRRFYVSRVVQCDQSLYRRIGIDPAGKTELPARAVKRHQRRVWIGSSPVGIQGSSILVLTRRSEEHTSELQSRAKLV